MRHRVARETDLAEGELLQVRAGDVQICLAKDQGCWFAINDICTHEEAFLSDGEIYKGAVQCPLHGSLFDLKTGAVTGLPALIPTATFLVTVEDGEIIVDV
jgi:3-phenylpropionate/trans-cinnamate dioxygenase ferredoxin subunit